MKGGINDCFGSFPIPYPTDFASISRHINVDSLGSADAWWQPQTATPGLFHFSDRCGLSVLGLEMIRVFRLNTMLWRTLYFRVHLASTSKVSALVRADMAILQGRRCVCRGGVSWSQTMLLTLSGNCNNSNPPLANLEARIDLIAGKVRATLRL